MPANPAIMVFIREGVFNYSADFVIDGFSVVYILYY